jgi:predicted CXXCH cytochrome family protein
MRSAGRSFSHVPQLLALIGCVAIAPSVLAGLGRSGAMPPPGVKPTTQTATCTEGGCHADQIQHKVMHGPAAQGKCLDCHEYAAADLHLFRLTMPKSDLCVSCHTLELKRHVHTPVQDRDCTGCHDPHGSAHPMILHAPASPQLCYTCHDRSGFEMKFVHGPVALGACTVCHDPHSTSHPKLLTQAADTLCIDCHSEADPAMLGAAARHLHKPMEDGCVSCHNPHASDIKYHLHTSEPELCYSCHEGVKNMIGAAHVHHGPVGKPGTGSCTSCHSPHFSHLPKLQKQSQPQMCLSCHSEPLKTNDGRTLTNMTALLRDHPFHHGPIGEAGGGSCTGCHEPHAGERFAMLHQEYPPQFYAPFETGSYQLCFSCHQPDLVLDKSGTGLTRFRDGDVNLHWLHVNKEKGRTCRACHEVHASSRPFHIREAVPFGRAGWMLEINFETDDDGGTCAPGCHSAASYSRSGRAPEINEIELGGGIQ